jgi:hypothetical protein
MAAHESLATDSVALSTDASNETSLNTIEPSTQSVNGASPIESTLEKSPDADEDLDSDAEDDKYGLEVNPARPAKQPSERRRLDDAAYQVWLNELQGQEQDEALRKVAASASAIADGLPDKSFMDHKAIIASPREYQTALFERAKEKNTIVVLDTGEF